MPASSSPEGRYQDALHSCYFGSVLHLIPSFDHFFYIDKRGPTHSVDPFLPLRGMRLNAQSHLPFLFLPLSSQAAQKRTRRSALADTLADLETTILYLVPFFSFYSFLFSFFFFSILEGEHNSAISPLPVYFIIVFLPSHKRKHTSTSISLPKWTSSAPSLLCRTRLPKVTMATLPSITTEHHHQGHQRVCTEIRVCTSPTPVPR